MIIRKLKLNFKIILLTIFLISVPIILLLLFLSRNVFSQEFSRTWILDSIRTCSSAVWDKDVKTLYYVSEGKIWSVNLYGNETGPVINIGGFSGALKSSKDYSLLAAERKEQIWLIDPREGKIKKKFTGAVSNGWDIEPGSDRIIFSDSDHLWFTISSKGGLARIKKSPGLFGLNKLYIGNKEVSGEDGIAWIFSPYASPVKWAPNGERLYFISERTGWSKIWSMDSAGNDIRQETFGEGDDRDFSILKDGSVVFVSNRQLGVEWSLWIKEKRKPAKYLFGRGGFVRGVSVSPGEGLVSFLYSTPMTPEEIIILNLKTKSVLRLTKNAQSEISKYAAEAKAVNFKSGSREIQGIIYIPKDASDANKLPAIIQLHGGPSMHDGLSWNSQAQFFSLNGYIVFRINYTGSVGYGKRFEEADRYRIGRVDCDDVIAGAEYLKSLAVLDKNKIGIMGGSYGGYLTNLAIGRYPRTFTAAVSWYGISDWNEIFKFPRLHPVVRWFFFDRLGDSIEHKNNYRFASPVNYADSVITPLLLVHGSADTVVPASQSWQFYSALKLQNKIVWLKIYDGQGHGWSAKEIRNDALNMSLKWFDKYLKGK